MPYKFSPSTLSLLKDCPKCFWLHFRENIKRPATIFPSLPGGMDRILKEYFDTYKFKKELPTEIANTGTKLFKDEELMTEWQNNFKGIRTIDQNGNTISGAVDYMLKKDNKLIVLDFKTRGYPPKEQTVGYYYNQLAIYTWLLQQNNFETKNYAYLLFYFPENAKENGEVQFNTELIKVPVQTSDVPQLLDKAHHVLCQPCPNPSKECTFCAWKQKQESLKAQTRLDEH